MDKDDPLFTAEFDNAIEIVGDDEQALYLAKKLEYMAKMLRENKDFHVIVNASVCATKKQGPMTTSRFSGLAGCSIDEKLPLKAQLILIERFVEMAQKVSFRIMEKLREERSK